VDEKYYLSEKMLDWIKRHEERTGKKFRIEDKNTATSQMIEATHYKGVSSERFYGVANDLKKVGRIGKGQSGVVFNPVGISVPITGCEGGRGAKTGLYCIADRTRTYANKGRNLESPKLITNALSGVQKDNLVLSNRIRRLTPKECERLQGFPDDWTEGVSDTQRYKQMGNAVSVPVIEAIGKAILNRIA